MNTINETRELISNVFSEDYRKMVHLDKLGNIHKGEEFLISGYKCRVQDLTIKNGKPYIWLEVETGKELKTGVKEVQHVTTEVKLTKDNMLELI